VSFLATPEPICQFKGTEMGGLLKELFNLQHW